MSELLKRRQFLTKAWQAGGAALAVVAGWTTWDLLRPLPTTGFGGVVRAVMPDAVPADTPLQVPAARGYLVRIDDEVVALSEKCTHLGCGVPYCESSGQFECPCHGTVFNRVGDHVAGPAPRGLDRYPVEVGDDGLLYIDTGAREDGPRSGDVTKDIPATGPACAAEGH